MMGDTYGTVDDIYENGVPCRDLGLNMNETYVRDQATDTLRAGDVGFTIDDAADELSDELAKDDAAEAAEDMRASNRYLLGRRGM